MNIVSNTMLCYQNYIVIDTYNCPDSVAIFALCGLFYTLRPFELIERKLISNLQSEEGSMIMRKGQWY